MYDNGEASRTWASANWFSMYLAETPRTRQCQMKELLPGNVVLMQGPQFGRPSHAMVVVRLGYGLASDLIYLAYHSTDTPERPLQDIQTKYPSETLYWYWRVLDFFPDPDAARSQMIQERGHIKNII